MRSREQRFACLLLAAAWAALGGILGGYAIARDSLGALVLALLVVWLMRFAWEDAWRAPDERDGGRRDVPFRF